MSSATATTNEPTWLAKSEVSGSEKGPVSVSILLQGPEKTYKTTMALSFPEPHVFYFDANMATLRNHAGVSYTIPEHFGSSWDNWRNQVVPAIVNRRIKARTIILDSTTGIAELLYAKLRKEAGKEEFDQDAYGRMLSHFGATFGQLATITKPKSDHPGYHLIITARYLNFRKPVLEYANKAVLPFYILHQSVLICVGYFVVQWSIPDLLKWLFILVSCFAIIMGLYEYLVRRYNLLRFLFGMKVLPKKKAVPVVEGQVATQ